MFGKIIDLDVPNANGSIYPKDVMEKAFKKYKEDMIDKGRAIIFSKCDDNLEYAYGLVQDISIGGNKGNEGFINFKALTVKDADVITGLIESGKLHCTTAGVGTVVDGVVQDDYEIRNIFLSDDPSYSI